MPDLTITITNLDTLDRALVSAPQGVETTTAAANAEIAPNLERSIVNQTPKRTGDLRASESVTAFEPMSLTFEATELYASFVNDGTERTTSTGRTVIIPPNPYIDRGVEDEEPRAIAVVESHFDRWVGTFGG
jgi:hypothetical protein